MSIGLRGVNGGYVSPQLEAAYQDIYQRVLAQTGDQAAAQEAVLNARNTLSDIYHQTMIATGGDEQASHAAVARYTQQVMQLAGLVPAIKGNDPAAAANALRQAMTLLTSNGLRDRTALYPWLREHVTNDQVLRDAGFDPEAVRRADTPWAHTDLEALMSLVRDSLLRYRNADGTPLTTEQIEAQLDQARAAARRYGVGTSYTAPAAGETAPTGTVTVAAFSFPRRV